jgi:hypothetical protein
MFNALLRCSHLLAGQQAHPRFQVVAEWCSSEVAFTPQPQPYSELAPRDSVGASGKLDLLPLVPAFQSLVKPVSETPPTSSSTFA